MKNGFQEELDYWVEWFETKGTCQDIFPTEYRDRLDPLLSLQPEFIQLMPPDRQTITILDVGAGPLTHVGKIHGNVGLQIIPVDALAREYDELLEKFGIVPPIRTQYGQAEELGTLFDADSFDIVCFRNSLDHCISPFRALVAALTVTRPQGYVFLQHEEFEGRKAQYSGLHQWDLYMSEGSFLVSGKGVTTNVSSLLTGMAKVTFRYDQFGWLIVTLQKIVTGVVSV